MTSKMIALEIRRRFRYDSECAKIANLLGSGRYSHWDLVRAIEYFEPLETQKQHTTICKMLERLLFQQGRPTKYKSILEVLELV